MANEAHKEPTMEEILASIRKIISDDSAAPTSAPTPEPEIIANDEDDEVATLEEVMFDEDVREEAASETFEPEVVADFEETAELEAEAFTVEEDAPQAEDAAESFESLLSASRSAEFEPEPEFEPAPEPVAVAPAPVEPAPAPAPMEKAMSASPAYEQTTLTEESTANAAAGALGKLISKMDLGTDNTLEGLVREMLRPMIKEWLDANLATIVEEKVEAEVQRIARMAR